MPLFAHLPLILKPSGKGKLSKRDADKDDFPIFPINWTDPQSGETSEGFREKGYLPEALLNFLAFLGWNPGTEQELFKLNELINSFSIERIGKAGTKFDINKAQWYNQQYLKEKSDEELSETLIKLLNKRDINISATKALYISKLMKERITFLHELFTKGQFFYFPPNDYEEKVVNKKWTPEAVTALKNFCTAIDQLNDFTIVNIKKTLDEVLEILQFQFGQVVPALRLAVTGTSSGPDLMDIIFVLGKREVIQRIKSAIEKLSLIKKFNNE